MPSLGEVFIKLGFDVDDAKLKGFQDKIDSVGKDFLILSGSAAGALYGLDRFLRGSVESATALENLHDVTGETTRDIQKWQMAGHLSNTAESIDQIAASIHAVNRAMGEGTLGGNADVFGLLNISPYGKDGKPKLGTEFLDELSRNFGEIRKRYSQFGDLNKLLPDLQKLGVSEGLYQALQLSAAQRDAMTAGLILSDEQLKKNKELATSMETMYQKFEQYKSAIVSTFAPDIEKAFDEIMPHIMKVAAGFHALQDYTGGWAAPLAASIMLLASPLGIAAASAATLVMALEQLAEIKRIGLDNYGTEVKEGTMNVLSDFNAWMHRVSGTNTPEWEFVHQKVLDQMYATQGSRDAQGNWVPPSQGGDKNMTVNQTNHIHGATDAESVAHNLSRETVRQLRDVYGQIDMGVRQ